MIKFHITIGFRKQQLLAMRLEVGRTKPVETVTILVEQPTARGKWQDEADNLEAAMERDGLNEDLRNHLRSMLGNVVARTKI